MNVAGIKTHFAGWRDWELNPIVVKELRQAVRSRAVTIMLLLFLAGLFITSLGFLISQSFEVDANLRLGGSMFSAFAGVLAFCSLLFIPLYLGIRVAVERQTFNQDLLYVSTLSPARIIFGKFLCGAYVTGLFFSACMPFMAFTNLLRGVDLPTVFFILAYLYLAVCAVNQGAIFLACLPVSLPVKILFAIIGLGFCVSLAGSLVGYSFLMMEEGVGAMMSHTAFWSGMLTFLAVIVAVTGLFFVLSVALIAPPSANRALPVRLYLTGAWLVTGLIALGWFRSSGDSPYVSVWEFLSLILFLFALLVVISNADQFSLRVRRTIPANRFKRAFAFLFYNGAAGGLVWLVLLALTTYFITYAVLQAELHPVHHTGRGAVVTTVDQSDLEFQYKLGIVLLYTFAYALTALFLHRRFWPQRPAKLTSLIAIILAAAWALMPGLILFFANKLSWQSIEGEQLGNVFNVFSMRDASSLPPHLLFASAWLALAVLLNLRWFFRQVKNFAPLPPADPENQPPVIG